MRRKRYRKDCLNRVLQSLMTMRTKRNASAEIMQERFIEQFDKTVWAESKYSSGKYVSLEDSLGYLSKAEEFAKKNLGEAPTEKERAFQNDQRSTTYNYFRWVPYWQYRFHQQRVSRKTNRRAKRISTESWSLNRRTSNVFKNPSSHSTNKPLLRSWYDYRACWPAYW